MPNTRVRFGLSKPPDPPTIASGLAEPDDPVPNIIQMYFALGNDRKIAIESCTTTIGLH